MRTWRPWHNPSASMEQGTGKVSGKFILPVLFVDGHTKMHNFTRSLTEDPGYPYEPTRDWIWYKPADDQTNSIQAPFRTSRASGIPSPTLLRR